MNPFNREPELPQQPQAPVNEQAAEQAAEQAYSARRDEIAAMPARQRFGVWAICRVTKWEVP